MKEVPNVDLSGIFGLEDLIKLSQSQNRNVAITNANEKIRNNLIALKFIENIGSENFGETPVEFFQKMRILCWIYLKFDFQRFSLIHLVKSVCVEY